jgi:hypothetical protein
VGPARELEALLLPPMLASAAAEEPRGAKETRPRLMLTLSRREEEPARSAERRGAAEAARLVDGVRAGVAAARDLRARPPPRGVPAPRRETLPLPPPLLLLLLLLPAGGAAGAAAPPAPKKEKGRATTAGCVLCE